jgi:ElaB/YqjD/DUF883 family membrane-anchored ribosome-binding protein
MSKEELRRILDKIEIEDDFLREIEKFIKAHPFLAVTLAMILGYLVGKSK